MRLILLQIGIGNATLHGLGLPHGLDTNWIGQFDWFNGDWDWFTLAHWDWHWIGTLVHIGALAHCTMYHDSLVHFGSGLVAWAQLTHDR